MRNIKPIFIAAITAALPSAPTQGRLISDLHVNDNGVHLYKAPPPLPNKRLFFKEDNSRMAVVTIRDRGIVYTTRDINKQLITQIIGTFPTRASLEEFEQAANASNDIIGIFEAAELFVNSNSHVIPAFPVINVARIKSLNENAEDNIIQYTYNPDAKKPQLLIYGQGEDEKDDQSIRMGDSKEGYYMSVGDLYISMFDIIESEDFEPFKSSIKILSPKIENLGTPNAIILDADYKPAPLQTTTHEPF